MRKIVVIIVVVFLGHFSAEAQNIDTFFKQADVFFKTYVLNGKVAYNAIKKDETALNEVLKTAKNIKVSKSDAANFKAFWINAYNLSVIKGVVDNYPTNSPLDDNGFFDKTMYSLGGIQITLNDIENKLLRGNFNDARFHFVLVCGAIGCPPLINKAYMPNLLESQLKAQTKRALNGAFLKVNSKKKQVEVSQIMKWYKEDFIMNGTTEINFINTYRTEKIPVNYKISYFEYNWKLNKQ